MHTVNENTLVIRSLSRGQQLHIVVCDLVDSQNLIFHIRQPVNLPDITVWTTGCKGYIEIVTLVNAVFAHTAWPSKHCMLTSCITDNVLL